MDSENLTRIERLEKRCDAQLQQLSDLQSSHCRLAESVRRLEAEVYTDPEVPDAPPPQLNPALVSAEQQARDMLERMGFEEAQDVSAGRLIELANLIAESRQHGAAQSCPYIRSSDEGTSYCALAEQAAPATEESSAPAPAGSLVERVAGAVCEAEGCGETPEEWKPEARAAIREVAAALLEWHNSDQLVHTAWEAAKWLEREAKR